MKFPPIEQVSKRVETSSITEGMTGSEERLAWIWVIEAMASFKEVSLPLLGGLVEAAPTLPKDSVKNAEEMVALRCLEELFARQMRHGGSSVPRSKVRLDVSDSCKNVLKRVVRKGKAIELKTGGSELAKFDIEPFIRHKRANMPKLGLEKLSCSICDGAHPNSDFLRRRDGLGPTNSATRACMIKKDRHSTTSVPNMACSVSEKASDEAISAPAIVENGQKSFEDNLNGGYVHTKRSRDGLASKDYNDGQNDNVKKAKLCASSVDPVLVPNLVSVRESERHEDAHNDKSKPCTSSTKVLELNFVSVSGRERHEDFSERGLADCTASQKPRENDNEELHGNVEIPLPVDASKAVDENLDEQCGSPTFDTMLKNSVEEARGNTDDDFQFQSPNSVESEEKAEDCHESKTSSDSHGCRNERTHVAKRKHVSNLTESLDPGIDDSSEQSPCMKCSEAGPALMCSGSHCQVAVHEKCLGSPAIFDDKGSFYCPFCAYSRAIAEYLDAKKKSAISLRELSTFIGKPKKSVDGLNKTLRCTEKDENRTATNINEQCTVSINEQHDLPETSNFNADVETKGKIASNRVTFAGKEKAVEECSSRPDDPQKVEECSSRPDDPRKEVHCTRDKLPGADTRNNYAHRRKEVSSMRQEALKKQDTKAPIQLAREFSLDSEEDSEAEHNDPTVSSYCIRVRKENVHYNAFQAIPLLRRKKVPWTTQEEEMIKEGVRQFTEGRIVHWKKILEFGNSVFLKGRTTIDLKDKWRNMCKGSAKS